MKRILWSAAVAALIVLSFTILRAGDSGHTANANEKAQIKIDNFSFGPAALTVPAGTTVTWTNQDDVPHTVVSAEGKEFKSPALDTDQKFSYTFAKAGTYAYFCSVHPRMTGKVVVQ
jgi:amicyanin